MRLSEITNTNNIMTKYFEKILFGSMSGRENDTAYENKVLKSIKKYIDNPNIKNEDFQIAMKLLIANKQAYPNILIPNAKIAYRGITVTDQYLKNFIKQYRYNEYSSIDVLDTATYKPKKLVESWTTKINKASLFTDHEYAGTKKNNGLIFQATIDDTFLFNSRFTNKLSYDIIDSKEFEIMRVSENPIVVKFIIPKKTKKALALLL